MILQNIISHTSNFTYIFANGGVANLLTCTPYSRKMLCWVNYRDTREVAIGCTQPKVKEEKYYAPIGR
jgi:hypothetical protein